MFGAPTINAPIGREFLRRLAALLAALCVLALLSHCGGDKVIVLPAPEMGVPSLIVVLPGQSFEAGVGISGSPETQTANSPFMVELIAVDEELNPYTNFPGTVGIFSSDDATPVPLAMSFPTGEGVEARVMMVINPITAGDDNILTPVHIDEEPLTPAESEPFPVEPGPPSRLIPLLPGQSNRAGTPLPEREPDPQDEQVGVPYQVRVIATDEVGNLTTSATGTGTVTILTNDPRDVEPPDAPLVNGEATFTIDPVFAQDSAFIRATAGGLTTGFSDDHVVLSQPAQDLYILLPTQSLRVDPAGPQVLGVPPEQTTGEPFQVRVQAADAFGNVDVTVSGSVTLTTPTDPADDQAGGDPYTLTMARGEAIHLLSLVSATSPGNPAQLAADGLSLSPATSSFFDVAFSGVTQIAVVLPGQSIQSDLGGPIVTGTPDIQDAGIPFDVEVHALDSFGNLDSTFGGSLSVSTNDPFDVDPGATNFVSGIATVSISNALATSSARVSAATNFDVDTSADYEVLAGPAAQLAVLLPGQTLEAGGSGPVINGTPSAQQAGSAFMFEVTLADAFGNAASAPQRTISVTTSPSVDSADSNPPQTLTTNGTATITHTPITAGADYQYTVSTPGIDPLPMATSDTFVVDTTASRLAVLLPDQSITIQNDGDGFAITGAPMSNPEVGTAFPVRVQALDFFGNLDVDVMPSVTVTTSDNLDTDPGAGALIAGERTFMVTHVRAGAGMSVSAATPSLSDATSSFYTVDTTATRLIAIDPFTQNFSPGAGGPQVSGSPQSHVAGESFQVLAAAIDDYGNLDSSETRQVSMSTTLDPVDTEPAPQNLSSGVRLFSLTAITARTGYTFTAGDSSGAMSPLSADTSDTFTISPATVSYLVVTLPGQSVDIGAATGMAPSVSGAAPTFSAGQTPAPLIAVRATDVYGNRVTAFSGAVRLSSNDPATGVIDQALSSGFREYPFTPYTDSDALPGGALTLTATDLGGALPDYTSTGVSVNGLSATTLYLRFPGETIAARSTGPVVEGDSDAQEVGTGFQAEVIAIDAFGNLDDSATLTDVEISTDDPGDAGPFNSALAGGVAGFTLTPSVSGPISVSIDSHSPTSLTNGPSRSYRAYPIVLGQADGTTAAPGTLAADLRLSTSVAIDTNSDPARVFVADSDNHRILGWASAAALSNGEAATLVIGQGDLTSGGCNRGNAPGAADANRLCEPRGLAVDQSGRLWVADTLNHRVLRFNDPFGTDSNADFVIGQANFTSGSANRGGSAAANTLSGPTDVEVDESGNIWIADTGNNRILRVDAPVDGTADLVLGQASFSAASCNRGAMAAANTLCGPMGLAVDGNTLWVADTLNHRALRYSAPAGGAADLALGQSNLTSATDNCASIAADTLCLPEDLVIAGTNVFVCDSGDNRVLQYSNPAMSGASAAQALGQPDLMSGSANNPSLSIDSLSSPADLFWWTGALFIADSANNRVVGRVP